jgi:hypothetical protein
MSITIVKLAAASIAVAAFAAAPAVAAAHPQSAA